MFEILARYKLGYDSVGNKIFNKMDSVNNPLNQPFVTIEDGNKAIDWIDYPENQSKLIVFYTNKSDVIARNIKIDVHMLLLDDNMSPLQVIQGKKIIEKRDLAARGSAFLYLDLPQSLKNYFNNVAVIITGTVVNSSGKESLIKDYRFFCLKGDSMYISNKKEWSKMATNYIDSVIKKP